MLLHNDKYVLVNRPIEQGPRCNAILHFIGFTSAVLIIATRRSCNPVVFA